MLTWVLALIRNTCLSGRTFVVRGASDHFTRMEWVADESWRTGTPKTPFIIVTLCVFATRRLRAFVHVVTSGTVRIARIPFRTFTVVSARKVCTQRTRTASVRQTTLVYVHTPVVRVAHKSLLTVARVVSRRVPAYRVVAASVRSQTLVDVFALDFAVAGVSGLAFA
jgi:hypothetical protein